LSQKYKLRNLNLKSNCIDDEGATELLTAVKLNPYILKIKLDLNPTRSNMVKEIKSNTGLNILKVSE